MAKLHILCSFEALGTVWNIYVSPQKSDKISTFVVNEIKAKLDVFSQECSRFISDSVVSKINNGEVIFLPSVSAEFKQMLDIGLQIQKLTKKSFSLGAGRRMSDAGYDSSYSFVSQKHSKKVPYITVKNEQILLKNNALLDFGSLGKGLAIDMVCGILQAHNFEEWLIDAGGDIRLQTSDNHPIMLQHPACKDKIIGVSKLKTGSCAASSALHRNWENGKHTHLIDNVSATSSLDIIGVFTQSKTAIIADALCTAFFVSPPQFHSILAQTFSVQYALFFADGSLFRSPGFSCTLL